MSLMPCDESLPAERTRRQWQQNARFPSKIARILRWRRRLAAFVAYPLR